MASIGLYSAVSSVKTFGLNVSRHRVEANPMAIRGGSSPVTTVPATQHVTQDAGRYLLELYRLSLETDDRIEMGRLGERLDVSSPSVTEMVSQLSDYGIVEYRNHHGARLTDRATAMGRRSPGGTASSMPSCVRHWRAWRSLDRCDWWVRVQRLAGGDARTAGPDTSPLRPPPPDTPTEQPSDPDWFPSGGVRNLPDASSQTNKCRTQLWWSSMVPPVKFEHPPHGCRVGAGAPLHRRSLATGPTGEAWYR